MPKEVKYGILSADKSADHRPINRPTVGRPSVGLMLSRFYNDTQHAWIWLSVTEKNDHPTYFPNDPRITVFNEAIIINRY